jgi:outer membrane receptor protein involved in Fe transport
VDLKYEIFPTAKELFSVGLFGKKIITPIERTFVANASNTTITTYLNSDSAILYGAEIDFLYDLSRINNKLANFTLGFNTSLMHTKVKVAPTYTNSIGEQSPSIETHKNRELQGASKYIINSDLKYQFDLSPEWSNTISLVYSVFAKRIYAVGTGGLDNIYELPVNQLDFVWGGKINKKIDLNFKIQNILNPEIKYEQGNNGDAPLLDNATIRNYKTGVNFSLNLGYTF